MSNPAWLPDPTGRHQYRWWDGERWTHHGADDGVATSDPVTGLDELSAPTNPQGTETGQIELVGRKANLGDGRTVTLASPGARLGAWLIDGSLLAIPLIAPAFFLLDIPEDEDISWTDTLTDIGGGVLPSTLGDWVFYLLAFAITFVYQVVFIATKGQTLGKMAAGVQVVGFEDGSIPGFSRAVPRADPGKDGNGNQGGPSRQRCQTWAGKSLGRWSLPYLILLIPLVGWLFTLLCYLSLTWGRDRQGWHDKAAGTLVTVK